MSNATSSDNEDNQENSEGASSWSQLSRIQKRGRNMVDERPPKQPRLDLNELGPSTSGVHAHQIKNEVGSNNYPASAQNQDNSDVVVISDNETENEESQVVEQSPHQVVHPNEPRSFNHIVRSVGNLMIMVYPGTQGAHSSTISLQHRNIWVRQQAEAEQRRRHAAVHQAQHQVQHQLQHQAQLNITHSHIHNNQHNHRVFFYEMNDPNASPGTSTYITSDGLCRIVLGPPYEDELADNDNGNNNDNENVNENENENGNDDNGIQDEEIINQQMVNEVSNEQPNINENIVTPNLISHNLSLRTARQFRAIVSFINSVTLLYTYKDTPTANLEQNKCVICLVDFEEGQQIRRLPCLHIFHRRCVDSWLIPQRKCPVCRNPLTTLTPLGSRNQQQQVA